MEHPIVEQAVKSNGEALTFLRTIARVLHFFDDLIDRDHPLDDAMIYARMWDALVGLPGDPFYARHYGTLSPILIQSILNWRIATNVERAPQATPGDLGFAFIIRSTYVDLVTMSAMIIGGVEHAIACGPAIRRWAHAETFPGYLRALALEKASRDQGCREGANSP